MTALVITDAMENEESLTKKTCMGVRDVFPLEESTENTLRLWKAALDSVFPSQFSFFCSLFKSLHCFVTVFAQFSWPIFLCFFNFIKLIAPWAPCTPCILISFVADEVFVHLFDVSSCVIAIYTRVSVGGATILLFNY